MKNILARIRDKFTSRKKPAPLTRPVSDTVAQRLAEDPEFAEAVRQERREIYNKAMAGDVDAHVAYMRGYLSRHWESEDNELAQIIKDRANEKRIKVTLDEL